MFFSSKISKHKLLLTLINVALVKQAYSIPGNVTISDWLWPQIRSSIANTLINTENYDPETAYREVFTRIPSEGNCWCFEEKKRVNNGKPQDLYDAACKKYHGCLKCGFYKLEEEFQEYALDADITLDFSETDSLDLDELESLKDIISRNNVMNHDAINNRLSIYDWICDENQDVAALSICLGFEQLKNDFVNIVSSEIEENLVSSYTSTCAREEGDCPNCSDEEKPIHVFISEFGAIGGPVDNCCGKSPNWKTFASLGGNQACCGDIVYNVNQFECCDSENSEVRESCEDGTPDPITDAPVTELPITNQTCSEFFIGPDCQENISPCQLSSSNPCINNGRCTGTTENHECDCEFTGFNGPNCNIQTSSIACNLFSIDLNSCKNGGDCFSPTISENTDLETCDCPENFGGEDCSENVSQCQKSDNNPCGNGGECFGSLRRFTCICESGFTGRRCETPLVEMPCAQNLGVCENYGVCVNGFEVNFGDEGVVLKFDGVICDCEGTGFEGENCEVPENGGFVGTTLEPGTIAETTTSTDAFTTSAATSDSTEASTETPTTTDALTTTAIEASTPASTEAPTTTSTEAQTTTTETPTLTSTETPTPTSTEAPTTTSIEAPTEEPTTPTTTDALTTTAIEASTTASIEAPTTTSTEAQTTTTETPTLTSTETPTPTPAETPTTTSTDAPTTASTDAPTETSTEAPTTFDTTTISTSAPTAPITTIDPTVLRDVVRAFAAGDPHYRTFDGTMVHPQRICAFTATQMCGDENIDVNGVNRTLPFFEVINDHDWSKSGHGYKKVSYVWGTEINYIPKFDSGVSKEEQEFWNFKLTKGRWNNETPLILTINNTLSTNLRISENFKDAKVAIRKIGAYRVVYLGVGFQMGGTDWLNSYTSEIDDFLIAVSFAPRHFSSGVNVFASRLLENRLCGVLGNFNNIHDIEVPVGQPAGNGHGIGWREHTKALQNEFARPEYHTTRSFSFANKDFSCEEEVELKVCTEIENEIYSTICGVINDAPFNNCDKTTEQAVEQCVFDLCQEIDQQDVVCGILTDHVKSCNKDGPEEDFIVSWRTETFCPMTCGDNQYFDGCGKPECKPTDTQCIVDNFACGNSTSCVEGCYCDDGWLMSESGECVLECDHRLSDMLVTCDDWVWPHTVFRSEEASAIDGDTNSNFVHPVGTAVDFLLDVQPTTLTKYIKYWPRFQGPCPNNFSGCRTKINQHTSIWVNDDSIECTPRRKYDGGAMWPIISAKQPIYFDCPGDVMVYNMRITNNGRKQVNAHQPLQFTEIQLVYSISCTSVRGNNPAMWFNYKGI